jgi:hypothetical protein
MCVGRTAEWVGDMCDIEGFDMFGTLYGADRAKCISEGLRRFWSLKNWNRSKGKENCNFIYLKKVSEIKIWTTLYFR